MGVCVDVMTAAWRGDNQKTPNIKGLLMSNALYGSVRNTVTSQLAYIESMEDVDSFVSNTYLKGHTYLYSPAVGKGTLEIREEEKYFSYSIKCFDNDDNVYLSISADGTDYVTEKIESPRFCAAVLRAGSRGLTEFITDEGSSVFLSDSDTGRLPRVVVGDSN